MAILTTKQEKLVRQCAADLARMEGFREYAYPDPLSLLYKKFPHLPWGFKPAREITPPGIDLHLGNPWTVGFGFTAGVTPDSRIDRLKAERLLEQKVLDMDVALNHALATWYDKASFVTKTVLINMAFNMGLRGLLGFKNTLKYMSQFNYKAAATNMRRSLWYRQVKSRAEELARRIETQEITPAN